MCSGSGSSPRFLRCGEKNTAWFCLAAEFFYEFDFRAKGLHFLCWSLLGNQIRWCFCLLFCTPGSRSCCHRRPVPTCPGFQFGAGDHTRFWCHVHLPRTCFVLSSFLCPLLPDVCRASDWSRSRFLAVSASGSV
jgi:hypothetical protein